MANITQKRLNILQKAVEDAAFFNELGFLIKEIIEDRSLAGEFLNADAKTEYSKAYEEKRQIAGLQVAFVDLQFGGEMWGAFDFHTSLKDLHVELGFNRDEMARIASYHDVHGAGSNKVIRQFLDLTESEIEEVHDWMLKRIGAEFDLILESNLPGLE